MIMFPIATPIPDYPSYFEFFSAYLSCQTNIVVKELGLIVNYSLAIYFLSLVVEVECCWSLPLYQCDSIAGSESSSGAGQASGWAGYLHRWSGFST